MGNLGDWVILGEEIYGGGGVVKCRERGILLCEANGM